MDEQTPCRCNGLNDNCHICGGSGYISDEKVVIIKTVVQNSVKEKEQKELESYINSQSENLYTRKETSKRKKTKSIQPAKKDREKRKKFRIILTIDENDPLKHVGINNPNRKKLGDTRELVAKKEAVPKNIKKQKTPKPKKVKGKKKKGKKKPWVHIVSTPMRD